MKFPSSIFSSETLVDPPWSVLRSRLLWLTIATTCAAEILVRQLLPADVVPRGAYHTIEFRRQFELYRHAAPVDLLIVGSSVAAANYPPAALDQRMRAQGVEGFTSFNGGIRGCNYRCIAEGIRRYYIALHRPESVLFVISPVDLDEANAGVIARSERFVGIMQQSSVVKTLKDLSSRVSYLYGFQGEVKERLVSGEWPFGRVRLGTRGYIDMGSKRQRERRRRIDITISHDSELSRALSGVVLQLAEAGSRVFLLPVEGDTGARQRFREPDREQLNTLLDSLGRHPNVVRLETDGEVLDDAAYIDSIHLASEAARRNAMSLADRLGRFDWPDE